MVFNEEVEVGEEVWRIRLAFEAAEKLRSSMLFRTTTSSENEWAVINCFGISFCMFNPLIPLLPLPSAILIIFDYLHSLAANILMTDLRILIIIRFLVNATDDLLPPPSSPKNLCHCIIYRQRRMWYYYYY